jgi:hypothetical protein
MKLNDIKVIDGRRGMKIAEVREILDRNFPGQNWPGREAEIIVLSRICTFESEVLGILRSPQTSEYQALLVEMQVRIEKEDPEAVAERLSLELERANQHHDQVVRETGLVTKYIQENISQFNIAQIRALANCRDMDSVNVLLESDGFKELQDSKSTEPTWAEMQLAQEEATQVTIPENWRVIEAGAVSRDREIKF